MNMIGLPPSEGVRARPGDQDVVMPSGKLFSLSNPNPADVDFGDVGDGLAKICPLIGATQFYSLAQRACIMHDAFRDYGDAHGAMLSMLGSAPLAYCGGLDRRQAPRNIVQAVFDAAERPKFAYQLDNPIFIQAERAQLSVESRDLLSPRAWPIDFTISELTRHIRSRPRIKPWPWPKAADQYRSRCRDLKIL